MTESSLSLESRSEEEELVFLSGFEAFLGSCHVGFPASLVLLAFLDESSSTCFGSHLLHDFHLHGLSNSHGAFLLVGGFSAFLCNGSFDWASFLAFEFFEFFEFIPSSWWGANQYTFALIFCIHARSKVTVRVCVRSAILLILFNTCLFLFFGRSSTGPEFLEVGGMGTCEEECGDGKLHLILKI